MSIKVYSPKGFLRLYEDDLKISSKTLYKVQKLLTKYDLLKITKWVGKAKSTFGLTLYYTNDASQKDFENYLIDYIIQDELRYEKQIQRQMKDPKVIKANSKAAWQAQSEAAAEIDHQDLSKQDAAKIELAAGDLQRKMQDLQQRSDRFQEHLKLCSQCKTFARDDIGSNCAEYHHLINFRNQMKRQMLQRYAQIPKKIVDQVETRIKSDFNQLLAELRSVDDHAQLPPTQLQEESE